VNYIITIIIPALVGTSILIGSNMLDSSKVIASAWEASNLANQHQIRTVLELYYLDHNQYPASANASELFDVLYKERYIKSKPVNPEAFKYQTLNSYQDYDFDINI
jgi:hypothetical protein